MRALIIKMFSGKHLWTGQAADLVTVHILSCKCPVLTLPCLSRDAQANPCGLLICQAVCRNWSGSPSRWGVPEQDREKWKHRFGRLLAISTRQDCIASLKKKKKKVPLAQIPNPLVNITSILSPILPSSKIQDMDDSISQSADNWWHLPLLTQELYKCYWQNIDDFCTSFQFFLHFFEAILTKVPHSWAPRVCVVIKIHRVSLSAHSSIQVTTQSLKKTQDS